MLTVDLVWGIALLYLALLFLVAYHADQIHRSGSSVTANATIYSLSIAVYATSWTYYGSVGSAATTGVAFLALYLGPTLAAFSWWFLLRKIIRVSKENNITSIADFISSRYGKSQRLGALITVVSLVGVMPYLALQLRAVSTSFAVITGSHTFYLSFLEHCDITHPGLTAALILGIFSTIFGARHLDSTERHDGLVAAIALESVVKLVSFLIVGATVTYGIFGGMGDIFGRLQRGNPALLAELFTLGGSGTRSYTSVFTFLILSMSAVMLMPRQFQVMVLENSDERHVTKAAWAFPAYLFLFTLFVMPLACAGILLTGGATGAEYFVLNLPLMEEYPWLALLVFMGGFSASAGMVMVESVAISTMVLNHVVMPLVLRMTPGGWFPVLLISLKRGGIFLVVLTGYLYQMVVPAEYPLTEMGLVSFVAVTQLAPAFFGGMYWPRGSKGGALAGIAVGFAVWCYTLLFPSLLPAGPFRDTLFSPGPEGMGLLNPHALFGLTGLDPISHALFWSLFLNLAAYVSVSVIVGQEEGEREQLGKFVKLASRKEDHPRWETKRLSKPVTIVQFVNLMAKFIGEPQAYSAISDYLGDREIDSKGGVSDFELPSLKRFVEKTLAGSLGGAAAGAVVESFLSDVGSRLEPVYDIFSTVRTSRDESREALFVRLRASEIMNRTLDLNIIMEDLLTLLLREFKVDLCVIRLVDRGGVLKVACAKGEGGERIKVEDRLPEIESHIGEAFLGRRTEFFNDADYVTKPASRKLVAEEGIRSFAHIPIASEGAPAVGVLSVYSRSIVGLFTEQFVELLESLAGQLAQAVRIVEEREAREQERRQKEAAQLEHAKVVRDLELAKQIQLSLLPDSPPEVKGVALAARCIPATHVGGDYYDFFQRGNGLVDLVMADVSGHSVGAALIMVETRSVLRAQMQRTITTGEALNVLNELLFDDLSRAELFITMFCGKYDAETRTLSYSNAGHTPPLLFRGERWEELDAEGLILGVNHDVLFEERQVRLEAGDLLFVYTDGIIEAQDAAGDLFGIDRLCSTLVAMLEERDPERIVEGVLQTVRGFTGSSALQDDVSMVVMKVL
ncbi:SpoIIE family protein phosphatase [Geomonas sp. RF6]|uniref:SpoIIE family protein phosphatase n=1 Tax=Geomonas sp. RF6 TaxID=2897342 RepID=UPI001E467B3C|nr:SpoIIE family protein phosphatase [Geomonas sp. RF6]UFS69677.1 SpoIIE family protein phosphatase [Geomonas sp. RF6]